MMLNFFGEKFFSYLKKFTNRKKNFQQKNFYLLKKLFSSRMLLAEEKEMKLIVRISINKNQNQNQMKKICRDTNRIWKWRRKWYWVCKNNSLHPREHLIGKATKINYSYIFFFFLASANYYRLIYGIKNRCIFASVDVHGTYTNVN